MENLIQSKKKKLVKTRKSESLKLPTEYPWKVLASLKLDLADFISMEDNDRLADVLRNRDLAGYFHLSDDWGLQCINTQDSLKEGTLARYQLAELLKKYEFPTSKKLREETAREKFYAAENNCEKFNLHSLPYMSNPCDELCFKVLKKARSFLLRILTEDFHFGEIVEWSRHGPGANLDTYKGLVDDYYKASNLPYSCTVDAYRFARARIACDQRWMGALIDDYRIRQGIPQYQIIDMEHFWSTTLVRADFNRIAFVPKDAKTLRSIAIEPAMNVFLQLGVDGYIRRRLMRLYGIDLDSQEKNRLLAYRGSITDDLVTIDLASASDSLSLGLCELLLPPNWFRFLRDLSSHKYLLDGAVYDYHKLCSMGNGFTFALETILFTALVYAVETLKGGKPRWDNIAVFGDDIVVPSDISRCLIEVLGKFGFTVNSDKTFLRGPVRESCGTDWFRGVPLRPVHLRNMPKNVLDIFSDANRIRRILVLRFGMRTSRVVDRIESYVPDVYKRYQGPVSDTTFDAYLHRYDPPRGLSRFVPYMTYRGGGYWTFGSIHPIRAQRSGRTTKFLFRKLMATLNYRVSPTEEGNAFTVYRDRFYTVRAKDSAAYVWQSDYSEQAIKTGLPL